jgi:hypothetical protein
MMKLVITVTSDASQWELRVGVIAWVLCDLVMLCLLGYLIIRLLT